MKFRIDTNGKHEVLDNFNFLQKNWSELDNMLRQDYVGAEVDLFLKQISNDFKDKQVFEDTMNTYFYYGLLFPPIPKHHNTEWLKLRKVLISDNSSIILKETIRFVSENEKTKTYQIEAQSISPAIDLISFSGKIELLKENNLVEKALIDLQYKNRIINAWTFSIEILKHKEQLNNKNGTTKR